MQPKAPINHRERAFMFAMALCNKRLLYESQCFYLSDGTRYTPDFHCPKEDIYYELVGTRQAWHQSKRKLELFKKDYPDINFKIIFKYGKKLIKRSYTNNLGIKKLRQLFKEKGLSQIKASELSGIPQPTISRHLNGNKIDPQIAAKYEKAFGIPKEDFICWIG